MGACFKKMETITLKCGCKVNEEGNFILSGGCRNCLECKAMIELHPFGEKRIYDFME